MWVDTGPWVKSADVSRPRCSTGSACLPLCRRSLDAYALDAGVSRM